MTWRGTGVQPAFYAEALGRGIKPEDMLIPSQTPQARCRPGRPAGPTPSCPGTAMTDASRTSRPP